MEAVKPGFTLIEILIAMMIVGIMATQLPKLGRATQTAPEQLRADLNALATQVHTRALVTGKIHQLYFDFVREQVSLRVATDTYTLQGDPEFTPLDSAYGDAIKPWNVQFEVESFAISGTDEAAGGAKLKTTWIYIMPDGLAQPADIVVRDTQTGSRYRYTLNPFFVQFDMAQV